MYGELSLTKPGTGLKLEDNGDEKDTFVLIGQLPAAERRKAFLRLITEMCWLNKS